MSVSKQKCIHQKFNLILTNSLILTQEFNLILTNSVPE